MISRLNDLRSQSIAVRATVLVVAVLLVFMVVGPFAILFGGLVGLIAAIVAAAVCLAGALLALIIRGFLTGPESALAALVLGMATRMGLPLASGLAIHLHGGPLAEAGFLYYLVVFYPITLAVETLLSLPASQRR
jgi:hypothetical protein